MLTSVVGINWGDEGKGRMVDLLSQDYDIVVRYQGGNNAGHTVVNDRGRFILNLLPSGILRDETVNVLGRGTEIDMQHLYKEGFATRALKLPQSTLKSATALLSACPITSFLTALKRTVSAIKNSVQPAGEFRPHIPTDI